MEKKNQQVKKGVLLFILLIGSFVSVLNQTILNVALPDLMKQFDLQATTVQWLSTGFMLVNGILIPVTAYLMKRFTTRQLFMSSMLLLFVGTLINALAPSFPFLLTGRLIQAAGAGIIMPLLMTVVLVIFPKESRGTAMGLIGLVMIFAPAIGPTLAGLVIEHYSWRWIFFGMLPLVIIVIALSIKYLVNVWETTPAKIDILSVVLSTLGFGGMLYGFSTAGKDGWGSPVVLSFLLGGVLFAALFCVRQLVSKEPLLDLRVFKDKMFSMTAIITVLISFVMYADMILLPLYLQSSRGYTVLDTGLLMLPGALINALMSPITGRLFDKFGAKPLALIGLLLVLPAVWGMADLSETTGYTYLLVRTIFLRIGFSFMTMPLTTAGLNTLPKHLNAHGSAISNTTRQIAGSIGTALVVTVMTGRSEAHASLLMGSAGGLSEAEVLTHSSMLGISDAYIFIGVIALLAFLLCFALPKRERVKGTVSVTDAEG